ncbi:hypothetical protein ES703_01291 [subsurface metagenome]
MEYPITDVGEHQPQLIWRDFLMRNVRIQHDKMLWLKDMIDIIDAHRFEDDFCNFLDIEYKWYLDESPGGSGIKTEECVDMVNGVLEFITNGEDEAYGELTQPCECWKLLACYPLYGEIRFYLSDVTDSAFWFGYVEGHNYLKEGAPDDYAVFHKDDGNAYLDFSNALGAVPKNSNELITLLKDTWYRLGIHWDGDGTIRYFVIQDGDFPQTILATGSHTTYIPTEVMSFGFGLQAGAAAAKTLYVDYVKSVQKRVIEAI